MLTDLLQQWRKRRAIRRIRRFMAVLGKPISGLTDAEIEDDIGVIVRNQLVAGLGPEESESDIQAIADMLEEGALYEKGSGVLCLRRRNRPR